MANFKYSNLVIILIVISVLFIAYYFLIARPKIKSDCLGASTNVVSKGEVARSQRDSGFATSKGEEVVLDEAKYKECIKIF